MSSGKRPIPGKKKKAKKKAEFPWAAVIAGVVGMVIAFSLMGGGYYVWKQRQLIAGYDATIAKISDALRNHDPEVTRDGLKPSDIEPLIEGKPEFTRETKEGIDYLVYTWRGGASPVGVRLKIEKNGSLEEVVEMSTLGAE
ncbi:MAG: hypothetical protein U0929_01095 [Planctomycetaceae bacterium]